MNPGRRLNPTSSRFFSVGGSHDPPTTRLRRCPLFDIGRANSLMVPSSNGQDGCLSSSESGFDSPWNRHHVGATHRPADGAGRNPAGMWLNSTRRVLSQVLFAFGERSAARRSGYAGWTCGFHVRGSDDPPTTRLRRCPPFHFHNLNAARGNGQRATADRFHPKYGSRVASIRADALAF